MIQFKEKSTQIKASLKTFQKSEPLPLSQWSLEQLVGQLFVLRWDAGEERRTQQLLNDLHPGGFILFGGNQNTTPSWIHKFQEESNTPLFIASDMERGVGQQIKGGIEFPSFLSIATTKNSEYAFQVGYHTGLQAKSLGVNVLFSPVADVNNNPQNPIIKERSFGSHPDLVAEYCQEYIAGATNAGVLSCAKHFPGHGDTTQDSHHTLPMIHKTLEELEALEFVPFRACIEANVPMIMTAHILYPLLSEQVATLSPEILQQILRQKLGYSGLLISDALMMKGLADYYSEEEASWLALKAGIELLLIPSDPYKAVASVLQAVQTGKLSRDFLEKIVQKILTIKDTFKIHETPPYLKEEEGRLISLEIARLSLVLEGLPWSTSLETRYLCFVPPDLKDLAQPFLQQMGERALLYSPEQPSSSCHFVPVLFQETKAYAGKNLSPAMFEQIALCIHNTEKCIWFGYPPTDESIVPRAKSMIFSYSTVTANQIALAEFLNRCDSVPSS